MVQGIVVLLGALLISFVLSTLSGNSAATRSGGFLTPEQVRAIEKAEGFDRPVVERFVTYLTHVVQGDFGESARYAAPALSTVVTALPYTLMLVVGALGCSLLFAVPLAAVSVLHRRSRWERLSRRGFLLWQGIPEFWLAVILVLVFSVQLGWLPSVGYSGVESAVLPIVALAVPLIPALMRLLRGQLLDVMTSDFIVGQRAKGLPERAVLYRHGFRNATPGFVTYLALQIGWLIASTAIIEIVFQWPGIGQVMAGAIQYRDLAVVQAAVMVVAVVFVVLNLLADLAVLWLDPRIRTGRL